MHIYITEYFLYIYIAVYFLHVHHCMVQVCLRERQFTTEGSCPVVVMLFLKQRSFGEIRLSNMSLTSSPNIKKYTILFVTLKT